MRDDVVRSQKCRGLKERISCGADLPISGGDQAGKPQRMDCLDSLRPGRTRIKNVVHSGIRYS
jgi:hypothetical protein